ncbi:MAG: N-acetylmuramoyl-L-alanine amidase, partial [Peptococcaceae bacterium]|nr:N-acetylmuramoyl-L-alanine amidase [Peptococcaceae bacterium]
ALNKRTEDRANSTWLAIYLKKTAEEVDDLSKKVVLDAGHGGADPGASGPGGIKEKDVVLQIALKVGTVLQQHGVSVIYTRIADIASTKKLSLAERVSIANKAKADLFVALHANAVANKTVGGQETYAYKAGTTAYKLAEAIQKEIVAASGLNNRGVKTADYHVLLHTTMPAALVETAFISNPDEERLLKDGAWQEKIAVAIAKGILESLGIAYKETAVKNDSVVSDNGSNFPESWNWAIKNGITDGSNPTGYAKREHVVEMLYRFAKKRNLL